MHAEIAAEQARFDAAEVSEAVAAKMVARHPHVFGIDVGRRRRRGAAQLGAPEGRRGSQGGREDESVVDRVPATLPALAWALGLQKRAARVGFDFASPATRPRPSPRRRASCPRPAMRSETFDEMGDLLFAIVSLARQLKVNPEDALRVAGQRFRDRFAGGGGGAARRMA